MVAAKQKLLLFGANGSIGSALKEKFAQKSWQIVSVTRGQAANGDQFSWNPLVDTTNEMLDQLRTYGQFDAVCWAQGQNCNDSIYAFNVEQHREVFEANVVYILQSLSVLLKEHLLKTPARLCVISSIWQDISRQNKLSYGVSKAALKGLVLSLANDLGADGHLINAVLPGALDTPMTRQNLSAEQLAKITSSTQFGRLPNLEDVVSTVHFLCSPENSGVTGQFVKIDLGFSDVRIV
jgi:NAD(P)-dependent dehydrogenase (short-subunit alcohol dehydrogenase family)